MPFFETDPSPFDLATLIVLVRQQDPRRLGPERVLREMEGERAKHLARILLFGDDATESDLRELRSIRRMAGLPVE